MLQSVIEVVKSVAQSEVMPRYLKVARQHKADGSLCTEADIASQAALTKGLQNILERVSCKKIVLDHTSLPIENRFPQRCSIKVFNRNNSTTLF